jgi:hypothetical protein
LTASPQAIAWIERSAWIAIYVGMLFVILGIVSREAHVIAGWSLGVLGAIGVIAGIVLILVRSRMTQAQSKAPEGNP